MTDLISRLSATQKALNPEDIVLEPQISGDGTVTFHTKSRDTIKGTTLERVYDRNHRLILISEHGPQGIFSETHYDPASEQVKKIIEQSRLNDGATVKREVFYDNPDRANEQVIVLSASGLLTRITKRQFIARQVSFQGETIYDTYGNPQTTVNQHFNQALGRIEHREQISWLAENQRAMTEHYYFGYTGKLSKYVKVLYYAGAGPFLEETQEFDPINTILIRRQLIAFSINGCRTCLDVLHYNADGQIEERQTTLFNEQGHPMRQQS